THTHTHTEKHWNSLSAVKQVKMTLSDPSYLQMIPEWKKQYICYETLKSMLKQKDRLNLSCYGNSQRSVTGEFFRSCEEELNKVNLFYSEKLSEAHNRLDIFGIVAQDVSGSKVQGDNCVIRTSSPIKRKNTNIKQIKMAVCELYLSLAFLQKYQEFNYRCFCKITIMYDSVFASEHGQKWRNERLDTSLLNTDIGKCEHLRSKLETFMIQLEGGDKLRAMKRLEVPGMDKTLKVGVWIMFRTGFVCGLILALLTILTFRVFNETDLELLKPQLKLYKGSFLLIEFLFLIGLNLYCVRFSPKSNLSLDCGQYSMAVTCLIQCFPPWLRFAQCLRCFWDTGHSLHLLNAGKYFTVFLMVTFAGLYNMARERSALLMEGRIYLYIWAVATCTGVLVTVTWDLRMDWGLLQGNGLLKDELVYSQQLYYYAAMLADVLLRVSWAINILLAQMKDSSAAATASALLAPLEVLRRCIWNLFRLENEQLKNCEKCCAVRDFCNIWRHLEKDQNVMYKSQIFPNQRLLSGTAAESVPS
ncbi:xenotropic and polytropic retrovirus receptor 1 homolog, partial [Siphateles boraxobius]|uniref:xenotropic and polytropic retrovirus receptor 1 homolog n=1 Tax=Siphateles boraxobius TaxID=180520 RepID=UPI004064C551